ncbi:MAG: glycosyltransferase family 2 protein [Ignavibacteriae bacterium]|nr:glycosyltransferase family 2 protein [Ignavibacteriota bacterium]
MDLTVIVVSYNTKQLLFECLSSVYSETKEISFEVIVVDNNSTDGSIEMLEKDFPQAKKILNSENKGFAAANNQAIRIAAGRYILLLNSDTKILDGAIDTIVKFMEKHPDTSIVGCKLLNADGTLQYSCRSFPSVWNLFSESFFLYKLYPRTTLFGSYYMTYFDHETARRVDVVMGAFMMIRRDMFEKIGLLDEQFFMYNEEVDFCFRAHQLGLQTYFVPEARVIHYGGSSIESTEKYVDQLHSTQLLFLRKHFGGFQLFMAVVLKYVGIGLRVVVYFVSGLLTFDVRWLQKSKSYLKAFVKSW